MSHREIRINTTFSDEDDSSSFLEHAERIAQPRYRVTDVDIMHARVRTIGISEHVFNVLPAVRYRVYDVGGDRSQRMAWAPFLTEELRAIIFMAPVGAFDQVRGIHSRNKTRGLIACFFSPT